MIIFLCIAYFPFYRLKSNILKMQHRTQQWKGATSSKFSSGRRHCFVENQLGTGLQPINYSPPSGIRTYEQYPTPEIQFSSSLKIYPERYFSNQKEIDLRGKKSLLLPSQQQRIRPQLRHVIGGQRTSNQFEPKGIKTFSVNNQMTTKQYQIENKMQRKARILGLQDTRNQINVSSLGDKAYKYPEYSVDFYKSGGLVPGSTNKYFSMKSQFTLDEKKLKSVFTKPNWSEVVKMEEVKQDQRVIDSVDQWEKTILKENNPKYNDPDTFFDRLQAAKGTTGKDAKKGAKK